MRDDIRKVGILLCDTSLQVGIDTRSAMETGINLITTAENTRHQKYLTLYKMLCATA
jgi:hypothetical protein